MKTLWGDEAIPEVKPSAPSRAPIAPKAAVATTMWGDPVVAPVAKPATGGKRLYSYKDLENALVKQESGGDYNAIGKPYEKRDGNMASMAKGQIAIGKYQIIPETWFKTIGLDHLNKADRRKFWKTPALQDQALKNVIAENKKLFPGSVDKQIVAYYGGPRAAEGLGTPAADEKYNGVSWNEYLASVKKHMRDAGPTGKPSGQPEATQALKTSEAPKVVAKAAPIRTTERQPWSDVAKGYGIGLPEVTKEEDPKEIEKNRLAAQQKKEDIAAGEEFRKARTEANKGRGLTSEQTGFDTPEEYQNIKSGSEQSAFGKTIGAELGRWNNVMEYVTSPLQGKTRDQVLGERMRATKIAIEDKRKFGTPEGKKIVKTAQEKFNANPDIKSLSEVEQEALAAHPGIIQGLKDFGAAFAEAPDKIVRDMAIQIINDGPVLAMTSMGIGSVLNAVKAAGYTYRGQKLVRYANKLAKNPLALETRNMARAGKGLAETAAPTPEVLARVASRSTAKATEDAAARALTKEGFASRFAEDQAQNVGATLTTGVAHKEAQGGDYTLPEGIQDLATGVLMGGLTSGLGAKFDTRASKATVEGARKVAHLNTFQQHPEVQSMLPMFEAIAKNKETAGIRYKADLSGGIERSREWLDAHGYPDKPPGKYDNAGQLLADEKTGKTSNRVKIGKEGDKAAIAEETTHYLQEQLRQKAVKDPEMAAVLQDVKDWEAGIKEAEKAHNLKNPENPITLPTGDELFGQTFTKYMGYGEHFENEGSIISRLVLPDQVVQGFKKLMGDDQALKGAGFKDGDIAAISEANLPSRRTEKAPTAGEVNPFIQPTKPMPIEVEPARARRELTLEPRRPAVINATSSKLSPFEEGRSAAEQAILEGKKLPEKEAPEPARARRPLEEDKKPAIKQEEKRPVSKAEAARVAFDASRVKSGRPMPVGEPMPVETLGEVQAGREPILPPAKAKEPPPPVQVISTDVLKERSAKVRAEAKAAADRAFAQTAIPEELIPPKQPERLQAPEQPKAPSKGISFKLFEDIRGYLKHQKLPSKDSDVLKWARANKGTSVPEIPKYTPKPTKSPSELMTHTGARVVDALTVLGSQGKKTNLIRIHPDDVGKVTGNTRSTGAAMTSAEVSEALGRRVVVSESAPTLQTIADRFNESRGTERATINIDKIEGSGPDGDFTHDDIASALAEHKGTRADVKKQVAKETKKLKDIELGYDKNKYDPKEETFAEASKYFTDYDDLKAAGNAPFQLKKSKPVQTEQSDMFGNKGRIASQGFIKGKNGDKGLEDTPLFGAADAEATAKAQKNQQSLFQLKKSGIKGYSDGNPPIVEKDVKAFRRLEAKLGQVPKELLRDIKTTWGEYAPEVDELVHKPLDHFLDIAARRSFDPAEAMAMKAKIAAMEHQQTAITKELAEAEKNNAPNRNSLLAENMLEMSDMALAMQALRNAGTRAGRNLAAHRVIMNPADLKSSSAILRKIIKELPGISNKEAAKLSLLYKESPEKFRDALRKKNQATWFDKALEIRMGGIMSGVGTQVRNTLSNASEIAVGVAETGLAGGIDKLFQSVYGGKRTRFSGEVKHELSGILESIKPMLKEYVKDAKDIITLKDKDIDFSKKFDYQLGAVGGTFGKVVRIPLLASAAGDKAAKTVTRSSSISKQAYRQAKSEGLSGKAAAQRANEIKSQVKSDPDLHSDIITKAYEEADFKTFQNQVDRFTKAMLNMSRDFKIIRIPMAFIKTPSNIFRRTLDRSPIAFVPFFGHSATDAFKAFRQAAKESANAQHLLDKAIKSGAEEKAIKSLSKNADQLQKNTQDLQGAAADRISRAVVGTTIFAAFYGAAQAGFISGPGPKDDALRYQKERSGWQAYSFVIPIGNGRYASISYKGVEPLSTLLGIAAEIAEGNAKNASERVTAALSSISNNVINKSYMSGTADVIEVFEDMSKGKATNASVNKYLANTAVSFLPFSNILSKTAQAIDPIVRKTEPESKGLLALPEQIVMTAEAKIPGLSKVLPARQVGTGGIAARQGWGNFFGFNVSLSKPEGEVFSMMSDLGYTHGSPPPSVYPRGKKDGKVSINDDETAVYQMYNMKSTKEIVSKMKSSRWNDLDDDEKKSLIQDVFRDNQKEATNRVKSMVRRRLRSE